MNDKKVEITFPSEIIAAFETLVTTFTKNGGPSKINDAYWEFQKVLDKYPETRDRLAEVNIKIKTKPNSFGKFEIEQTLYFNAILIDAIRGEIPLYQAAEWFDNSRF